MEEQLTENKKSEIIQSLKKIETTETPAIFGSRILEMNELIDEIEKESELGVEFCRHWIEGQKLL